MQSSGPYLSCGQTINDASVTTTFGVCYLVMYQTHKGTEGACALKAIATMRTILTHCTHMQTQIKPLHPPCL